MVFNFQYIPDGNIRNLDKYKYRGIDYSWVANNIMQRYWTFIAGKLPLSIAPNMLTLIGFIIMLSSFGLLAWHTPAMTDEPPAYIWWWCAIALFLYQTLDAADGKQARRTDTSSPMGELFDHGCDAVCAQILALSGSFALGASGVTTLFMVTLVGFGMHMGIWEQYCTGVLNLGYINGPTDGLLIQIAAFVLTAVKGRGWYRVTKFQVPFISDGYLAPYVKAGTAIDCHDMFLIFMILAGVTTILANIYGFMRKPRDPGCHNPYTSLLPIGVAYGSLLTIVLSDKTYSLEKNPRLPSSILGFMSALCATRMTIARLTIMEYRASKAMLAPVVLSALYVIAGQWPFPKSAISGTFPTQCFLQCYLVWLIVLYLHLSANVFHQVCEYLDINLLTFTEKQKAHIAKKHGGVASPRKASEAKAAASPEAKAAPRTPRAKRTVTPRRVRSTTPRGKKQ